MPFSGQGIKADVHAGQCDVAQSATRWGARRPSGWMGLRGIPVSYVPHRGIHTRASEGRGVQTSCVGVRSRAMAVHRAA